MVSLYERLNTWQLRWLNRMSEGTRRCSQIKSTGNIRITVNSPYFSVRNTNPPSIPEISIRSRRLAWGRRAFGLLIVIVHVDWIHFGRLISVRSRGQRQLSDRASVVVFQTIWRVLLLPMPICPIWMKVALLHVCRRPCLVHPHSHGVVNRCSPMSEPVFPGPVL